MEDASGRVLVYQNATGDKLLNEKIKEIQRRAQVIPGDAVYYVIFKNRATGEDWAYKYTKGNPVTITHLAPMQERAAVDYNVIESKNAEIARLQNEIDRMKLQMIYENDLNNLRQEIKSMSESKPEPKNEILTFAETILPQFMPLLTEYLEVRKIEAQAKSNTPTRTRQAPAPAPRLPLIGTPEFMALCERLAELSDEKLDAELAKLENINSTYANAIREILYTDDNEETSNENQNNGAENIE
ncbi:MAG: hypothetical protein EBU84_19085 [Actinobacteria bacterium]|nr:hypothetical protein [Actinomycetota bacterium]